MGLPVSAVFTGPYAACAVLSSPSPPRPAVSQVPTAPAPQASPSLLLLDVVSLALQNAAQHAQQGAAGASGALVVDDYEDEYGEGPWGPAGRSMALCADPAVAERLYCVHPAGGWEVGRKRGCFLASHLAFLLEARDRVGSSWQSSTGALLLGTASHLLSIRSAHVPLLHGDSCSSSPCWHKLYRVSCLASQFGRHWCRSPGNPTLQGLPAFSRPPGEEEARRHSGVLTGTSAWLL